MTLLVRNEADVVDAQLAFHLAAGVDFVIATDNRSDDGTSEILERYEAAGVLHLLREPGDDIRQGEWVTRMARLAATDFGADWVINADADEFWWPRGGTLNEVLASVPERYGVVRGAWRHFLPRPEDGSPVFGRMTVRLRTPAPPGSKATIYHAHQKVAHRARADVRVAYGNHDADVPGRFVALRGWYPVEVLHFPFRSLAQVEAKATRDAAWLRNVTHGPTLHHELAHDAVRSGRVEEHYRRFLVDDEALARGLADGTLSLDTRLRGALQTIGSAAPGRVALAFEPAGVADDAAYVAEISGLLGIDGILRSEERVEALERRLAAVERTTLGTACRSLGRRLGLARRRHTLAPR